MNKFQKFDELLKSEALTADDMLKYWVRTRQLSTTAIRRAYFCFPISRSMQHDVNPGMFWYTDDTVSKEFIPEKEIKSIVLYVDEINNKIYGDTFYTGKNSWEAVRMYFEHHPEYTLFNRYQFSQVVDHWDAINRARQEISLQVLLEGDYWTPDTDIEHALLAGYAKEDGRIWGCDNHGMSKPLHVGENDIFWRVMEYDVRY